MFRCHYTCDHCKRWWNEVWDEIEPMACWGCQVTARPYRAQYVKPTRLLDIFLLTPDPNQLKLFGDDSA